MAVRIRLSRFGRLHRPYFRIVAIDGRCHREGKANEILGSYDPLLKDKNIQIDMEKVQSWIARGALVSESLTNLLKHHGYPLPAKAAAPAKPAKPAKKPAAKAPGKKGEKQPWVAPTRRSLRKHAAKLKGERKAKLVAEAAAKAAAAPAAPAEGAAPAEAAKT
jgi:small subunit ribosomal protein S16